MANEIIRGKLLSLDGQLALVVLALDPSVVDGNGLRDVIGEIRKTVGEDLANSGLAGQLSGVPVMQLEIRNAVERDRLIYNAFGFAAGCLIAIVFFRRVSFMVMAAGPPLIAIVLALGALGWLDFRLNMFLNVMTPLIMVISFSDSMQLTFAARDGMLLGKSKSEALRNAILVVGPACVLTHATAGVSFIALQFSSSDLIRTFGEAGLAATLIALVAVLMLVPLLGVLLVRKEATFTATVAGADRAVNTLRRVCGWIAARMVSRPGFYSAISVLLVGGLAFIYANLEPRYRLADQVPDREQAVEASSRLDAKLTGANPIDVLIEFPKGASLYAPETLADHRRRSLAGRETGGRRQRLVAGNAAALAGREGRQVRPRHAEAICRRPARAPGAPFHCRRAGRRCGVGPHSGHRREPAAAGGQGARRQSSTPYAPPTRAMALP